MTALKEKKRYRDLRWIEMYADFFFILFLSLRQQSIITVGLFIAGFGAFGTHRCRPQFPPSCSPPKAMAFSNQRGLPSSAESVTSRQISGPLEPGEKAFSFDWIRLIDDEDRHSLQRPRFDAFHLYASGLIRQVPPRIIFPPLSSIFFSSSSSRLLAPYLTHADDFRVPQANRLT